jgi:adenosylhomocysteine nucleosidase
MMSTFLGLARGLAALGVLAGSLSAKNLHVAVLISANAEWQSVVPLFRTAKIQTSPYGEYFFAPIGRERVLFFHGGWGKVAAAGSAQYVIDRFHPERLINIGTCGGVEGRIKRFDVVALEKVVIYDIAEAMGDSKEAIESYSTSIPLPDRLPGQAIKTTMYSADRDLTPAGLRELENTYAPVVADWESGAIAWVAHRNSVPVLILRGVSDLVSREQAEAQSNLPLFQDNAARVMRNLVESLPDWLAAWH